MAVAGENKGPATKITISDPAFWAAHPDELREAMVDAAGGDVSALRPRVGLLERVAEVPGHLLLAIVSALTPFHLDTGDIGHERLTLTVEEAAERLGISRAFAYEAVRRGEIPHIKIGRRILVPKVALDRLLEVGLRSDGQGHADSSPTG